MDEIKAHFIMLAAYDRWANARIFDAIAGFDRECFDREGPAGSLNSVFTTMLAADRLWLHRFTGQGDTGPAGKAFVTPQAASLARAAEDERILTWLEEMPAAQFGGRFSYMTVSDMRTISERLLPALSAFFSRHVHQRGLACAVMAGCGPVPDIGMAGFQKSDDGRRFK